MNTNDPTKANIYLLDLVGLVTGYPSITHTTQFSVNVFDGCLLTTFTATPPFASPFYSDYSSGTTVIGTGAFT